MTDEVVYVVERFPQRSQTFIQNEIRHLHRLGIHPSVVALYPVREADPTAHDLAHVVLPSAARRPDAVVLALGRVALRHPLGLLRAVGLAAGRPQRLQLHALAKAVLLVGRLRAAPGRFHAHFARASASTAMLAAAITGARFSFTAHAVDIFVEPFDVDRKLRRADVTVTVCEYNRRFLDRTWPGLGHVVVVPCGVDPATFTRQAPYQRDPFTIVAVGRLVEKKGFDVLVRSCALLKHQGVDLRCRIVGDGPLRAALEELIADHDLTGTVVIDRFLPPSGVRDALESATVFCLPCVVAGDGNRDSQPVVIKEAMAMSVPVVASDEVGVPEMVDASNGRLAPPRDPAALAAALRELVELPEADLRALGARGRARVEEEFAYADLVPRLAAAWRSAGESPGRVRPATGPGDPPAGRE